MPHADIKIGVSACLLGREVRYDGGHKLNRFVADVLGQHVSFVPVCPEVEVGMGTPRETLRLFDADDGAGVRMLTTSTKQDHTASMTRYTQKRLRSLARERLCGFILKSASPSCAMQRAKVYRPGRSAKSGSGIFAQRLLDQMPNLPVQDEVRLDDPILRENFIERIFAYRRLADFFAGRWTLTELIRFHARQKLQLMAHSPVGYRQLGNAFVDTRGRNRKDLAAAYQTQFMRTLDRIASTRKHTTVLTHAAARLKKRMSTEHGAELAAVIEKFRRGLVPLLVPLTLLEHHSRRQSDHDLTEQTYLQPHPAELLLRNHA